MGSTQVVSLLKRLLKPTKIGHAGTLDPLATGVLPIAFGKATRLIPYVMEGKKTYLFTIRWGVETDSDDLAGTIIQKGGKSPSAQDIANILPQFTGNILQTPNAFSALKVNGQRAYELARQGKTVPLMPRSISVYELKLLNATQEEATFEATCSKGTYIRTLAHDIAHALGTIGVVSMLRRTMCAPFNLSDSISVDKIKSQPENLSLFPMEAVVHFLPSLSFDEIEIKRLSQGQRLSFFKLALRQENIPEATTIFRATCHAKTIGLVQKKDATISPELIWTLP